MKTYIANYHSPDNAFKGELVVLANDHKEAMNRVFEWVKTKEVWNHLWKINIDIREVEMDLLQPFPYTKKIK